MANTVVNDLILPKFWPLVTQHERNMVFYGGAGSGKSFNVAQWLAVKLSTESPHCFLFVRKVKDKIRHSMLAQFIGNLKALGLWRFWRQRDLELTCLSNGNTIYGVGMDDHEKLKSITAQDGGSPTGAWVEEANQITRNDSDQIHLRLRGERPHPHQCYYSLNPVSAASWIKNDLCDRPGVDTYVNKSTYRDNPRIGDAAIKFIEGLRKTNPGMSKVYADGDWGSLEGQIYTTFTTCAARPEHPERTIFGLDFGFGAPLALVRGEFYMGTWYWSSLIYETDLTDDLLKARLSQLGISPNDRIIPDSEDPMRIQTLRNNGYYVSPAAKGPGSVNAGIATMSGQKHCIVCDLSDVTENPIMKEVSGYVWDKKENGDIGKERPADSPNHALDAMRYAIVDTISEGSFSLF